MDRTLEAVEAAAASGLKIVNDGIKVCYFFILVT